VAGPCRGGGRRGRGLAVHLEPGEVFGARPQQLARLPGRLRGAGIRVRNPPRGGRAGLEALRQRPSRRVGGLPPQVPRIPQQAESLGVPLEERPHGRLLADDPRAGQGVCREGDRLGRRPVRPGQEIRLQDPQGRSGAGRRGRLQAGAVGESRGPQGQEQQGEVEQRQSRFRGPPQPLQHLAPRHRVHCVPPGRPLGAAGPDLLSARPGKYLSTNCFRKRHGPEKRDPTRAPGPPHPFTGPCSNSRPPAPPVSARGPALVYRLISNRAERVTSASSSTEPPAVSGSS